MTEDEIIEREVELIRQGISELQLENASMKHELKTIYSNYKTMQSNLKIAIEALNFYSQNDLHSSEFNFSDNGKRAKEALIKVIL